MMSKNPEVSDRCWPILHVEDDGLIDSVRPIRAVWQFAHELPIITKSVKVDLARPRYVGPAAAGLLKAFPPREAQ
jgi:hypothetical protein